MEGGGGGGVGAMLASAKKFDQQKKFETEVDKTMFRCVKLKIIGEKKTMCKNNSWKIRTKEVLEIRTHPDGRTGGGGLQIRDFGARPLFTGPK